jgi:hypothetical protein
MHASTQSEKEVREAEAQGRYSLSGELQRKSRHKPFVAPVAPVHPAGIAGKLGKLLTSAKDRFNAVVAAYQRETDIEEELRAAEAEYQQRLDAQSLERLVKARSRFHAISQAGLQGDVSDVARFEHDDVLNDGEGWAALADALDGKVAEFERAAKRLRGEFASAVKRYQEGLPIGGALHLLPGSVDESLPEGREVTRLWRLTEAAEDGFRALLVKRNRARGIAAGQPRNDDHFATFLPFLEYTAPVSEVA